jgi:SAM-dependent methyltransferase
MPAISFDSDTEHLAREYERVSAERQFQVGKRLLEQLRIRAGENVLDIGAGTGLLAEYVAGLVGPDGSVIGIDPLPLRIDIASRRNCPNLAFRVGNANDLSEFSENHFDAAYVNAVFHWLPEKRTAAPDHSGAEERRPLGHLYWGERKFEPSSFGQTPSFGARPLQPISASFRPGRSSCQC